MISVCGPDEWEICVQEPSLGRLEDGSIPGPEVPESDQLFPSCSGTPPNCASPKPKRRPGHDGRLGEPERLSVPVVVHASPFPFEWAGRDGHQIEIREQVIECVREMETEAG